MKKSQVGSQKSEINNCSKFLFSKGGTRGVFWAKPFITVALLMLFILVNTSPAHAIDFKDIDNPLIQVFC
jgi:hypothetical protein